MADIGALMKRCQIGVPRGPNAYDDLHSILAECYGALGKLSDQLHLAEVARVAQVEGLTQGAAGWRERANQLEAQVAALEVVLDDAIEEIEGWGEYAPAYFKQKHDLEGTLARFRAARKGAA